MPDNDATAAQGVDLLALAAKYDCDGITLAHCGTWSQEETLRENWAIATALREKAARDAAPADPDLTPSDLEVLAREHDSAAAQESWRGTAEGIAKARTEHRATARALRFYAAAIDGRNPAAPPAQPASQVTLNCARCVQNGETAANVAGATCGRCGNATPAASQTDEGGPR